MPNQILKTRVLGEVGKNNLLLCQAKGDTAGSSPEKLCPNPGRFGDYSSGSKAGFADKDQDMCRAFSPLIWPQVVS